jgi:hypothetical protein
MKRAAFQAWKAALFSLLPFPIPKHIEKIKVKRNGDLPEKVRNHLRNENFIDSPKSWVVVG